MRLATVVQGGVRRAAIVRDGGVLPLAAEELGLDSIRAIAESGPDALRRIRQWADRAPEHALQPLDAVELAPAVPDPGAIYTVGANYAEPGEPPGARSPRPLIYAKLPTSVSGHGATVSWDRSLTANVDPEVELGIVVGGRGVFGYTCINDISSRDPWLDGDQWLLGKSFAGFCPVGPWIVTGDELEPFDLRLGCTIGDVAIQDGSTAAMRFSVAEVIAYLSRYTTLRPGDLIATGTPTRMEGPLGPDRHLEPGDVVTVWIERIGELTTIIA